MNQSRVRKLNENSIQDGPIIYWMDRDMRINDNWAFIYAQEIAQQNNTSIIVVYNLVTKFLGGGSRQEQYKYEILSKIKIQLEKMGIPFFILVDDVGVKSAMQLIEFIHSKKTGAVVTDFSPLRIQREWKKEVAINMSGALFEVDTHNIIPAWIASPKLEYAAYTIRPKIHKLLPMYLDEFPPSNDSSANTTLTHFIENKLNHYADMRNDALADAQSNLSPFLHYGTLASQRIAIEIVKYIGEPIENILDASRNKAKVEEGAALTLIDHAGAFLEELIVRRELSDNFCLYNEHYDSVEGFPTWAQKSLSHHAIDPREYIYTLEQFELSETHDDLWNAAQREMCTLGKMHGYMRMYWAKKILEWTESPEDAMRIAIYLNDKYSMDGRDPNGYAGIAWSIGGVHDRAWFERPIFGMVRYMARSGCEKKFNVKEYINKHLQTHLVL